MFVYEREIEHYEAHCTLAAVLFIKYKTGRSQIKFPDYWTKRLSAISWPSLQTQEIRLSKFYKTNVFRNVSFEYNF